MDCSKTEVFLSEWKRMCVSNQLCNSCNFNAFGCANCRQYVVDNIEDAIEILQEWSDANQVKTRASVFLRAFPNARKRPSSNLPVTCAQNIFNIEHCAESCEKCWNTPVKGE